MHLAILLAALLADWFIPEPEWLWRKFPHPVALFGRLIDAADRRLNQEADTPAMRYRKGAVAFVLFVAVAGLAGWALSGFLSLFGPLGWLAEIAILAVMLAQRSLKEHVAAVRDAMIAGDEGLMRSAIGRIVGRDPARLDRSGTARAAIESLAENYSDGVVAPAFWYAIFGLPGLFIYKMINTADSMIGHRNDRYREFGNVAARMDDLANWLPARLSAALIAAGEWPVQGSRAALRIVAGAFRDSGLHRSPNAGWPEAAMAQAGGFALGGPRHYAEETVEQVFINAGGRASLEATDITAALAIYARSCLALWALTAVALLLVCAG